MKKLLVATLVDFVRSPMHKLSCYYLAPFSSHLPLLLITLENDRICAHGFTLKLLEYRKNVDTTGSGKVLVVHTHSTFSVHGQLATPQNSEVQKYGKIWGILPLKCNRINRLR